ncbi:amidase [Amycolatopsis rubida]|uniref:Amidase n=1 Tax=Amycolatopsis rubida TaxID=112413 RepID=A0ABX0C0G9_9PSEU|nr:amidase [Amycolatopsis sp. M39]MYW96180.1 Asp-tRNA(Asn)/Glu-tRNA(Gln) amidotransferase GatCAB subunit A [Amycolatopsis rubida]NEC61171.1 amidase [Amycolatopsis rubida]OAP24304.1 Glutamyl-tRNA(Gln) amidotransferase subunit A [Amycolatopsis sp. M39]
MNEILDFSIAEALRELVAGNLSSVELTTAALSRIERTEPILHAYAAVAAEAALSAARMADDELRHGLCRGPLHGIPVGVKDVVCTRNLPTEAGSAVLKGVQPNFDATVVERLRHGGAVLVGKTVTSEFAFGPRIIPTRNAWAQDRTPSGSSSGSAVSVAARSCFAAVATDTAGSLRSPAGVNGVVGLKPTFGRVSTWGVIPMSPSLDHVGPIARTVADCAAAYSVIAGFDQRDPCSIEGDVPLPCLENVRLDGLRVGVERTHLPGPTTHPLALNAAVEAAAVLQQLGAAVVEVKIPELEWVDPSLLTIKTAEASAGHSARLVTDAANYQQRTRVMLQAGAMIPAVRHVQAQQARKLVTDAVRETFRRHRLDALLGPGWGPPSSMSDDASVPFTHPLRSSAVNLTGMPAVNVPCGFTEDGVPLGGIELWGRPRGEGMILRIAAVYERVGRWHRRVPPIAQEAG